MINQEIPDLLSEEVKGNEAVLPRLSQSLNNLKSQTVTEASEVVAGQIDKLKKFSEKIADILEKIGKSKEKCSETIKSLGEEEKQLSKQVEEYKRELKINDVEERLREGIKKLEIEYIKVCKERIKVANSLDIKKMSKIQIDDRKSMANEVFRWIIVAIYTEPESKYYWPNFQQEALKNDKGKDLIQRLGKVSSMSTKQEQRVKTQNFLDHQAEIKKSIQLKDATQEIDKIIEIAKSFKAGFNISQEIVLNQKKIQKHRQQTIDKDQDNLRSEARISAIQGRIDVNRSFLDLLEKTESQLGTKIDVYNEKIKNGQDAIQQLDKLNTWTPKINLEADPTSNCESCRLF